MLNKLKAFFAWLWDWVTVLAGVLVGLPAAIFEALDSLAGTDLTPILPAGQAAKIITAVAIAKAIYASMRKRVT